jgi:hypothetical protein
MTDREGLFCKRRNPNSSQPLARPLTCKYSFCQAGERALHRDVPLWGCSVTRFKTSPPFFEMMLSFTSFGKKTLAVLPPGHRLPFFQNAKVLPHIYEPSVTVLARHPPHFYSALSKARPEKNLGGRVVNFIFLGL